MSSFATIGRAQALACAITLSSSSSPCTPLLELKLDSAPQAKYGNRELPLPACSGVGVLLSIPTPLRELKSASGTNALRDVVCGVVLHGDLEDCFQLDAGVLDD